GNGSGGGEGDLDLLRDDDGKGDSGGEDGDSVDGDDNLTLFRRTRGTMVGRGQKAQEGALSTYKTGESSTAHVLTVTGESVHHTVPLLAARLIRHKSLIEEIHDHLREVSVERIETLKQEHVADAMTTFEANRASGNETHKASGSAEGTEHTVHNCSYKEFLICKPHYFKGMKGAIGLTCWFEKTESKEMKRTMIDEYCPINEIQKMESKLWNLKICPKLGNQNRRNQGNNRGNRGARGRAFGLSGGEAAQDPSVVTGTFLVNNRYATVLFDSGADRSFISTKFNPLISIAHTTLDVKYYTKLAKVGEFFYGNNLWVILPLQC
nr:putative reverse transcriptase domain-containing protein [Tanacetum cinerariifolium]